LILGSTEIASSNINYATGNYGILNDGLKLNKQIVVISNNLEYEFGYSLQSDDTYTFQDCPEEFPYEYDLVRRISDECGELASVSPQRINDYDVPFSIDLSIGEYNLYKDLRVSPDALQEHWDTFVETSDCILSPDDFMPQFVDLDCGDLDCVSISTITKNEFITQNLENDFGSSPIPYQSSGGVITPSSVLSDTVYEQVEQAIEEYNDAYDIAEELCTIPDGSNIFENFLPVDFYPGGQYGNVSFDDDGNITDPTSIFNEDNELYHQGEINGDNANTVFTWRNPVTPYTVDGIVSRIPVTELDGSNFPAILEGVEPDQNNTVAPEELANVSDFLSRWSADWAHSLVSYHPEYPYLQYSQAVSDFEHNGNTSFSYTEILQNIDSYTVAVSQGYFASNTSLLDNDPYFNGVFAHENSQHRSARREVMLEALTDSYDGQELNILQVVYRTIACGYLATSCPQASSSFATLNNNIAGLSPEKQDQIWQLYKSYYLGLKERLFYVFQSIHARTEGVENSCLAGESGSEDVIDVIGTYDAADDVENLIPSRPSDALCRIADQTYAGKLKRYIPIDNLYDSELLLEDPEEFIEQLEGMTDLEIYEQTGKCGIQYSLEAFLNGFFNDEEVDRIANLTLDYEGNYITPELFEALGGDITVGGDFNITTSISGRSLTIRPLISNNQCSNPVTLTLPSDGSINSSYTWSNYGTSWSIDRISLTLMVIMLQR